MSKKSKISQEDLDAFHKALHGTKPFKSNKIRLSSPTPHKKPIQSPETLESSESLLLEPVQSEEFITFKQPSISNKILRNLRKGQYNIEAKLDLHGMSVEKAKKAVDFFLQQCLHKEMRVVLIIHGKGHLSRGPILKNKLNHWLRTLPEVLAFCSASAQHGSRGATYVLLRNLV